MAVIFQMQAMLPYDFPIFSDLLNHTCDYCMGRCFIQEFLLKWIGMFNAGSHSVNVLQCQVARIQVFVSVMNRSLFLHV